MVFVQQGESVNGCATAIKAAKKLDKPVTIIS
jgi:hypothetical protein